MLILLSGHGNDRVEWNVKRSGLQYWIKAEYYAEVVAVTYLCFWVWIVKFCISPAHPLNKPDVEGSMIISRSHVSPGYLFNIWKLKISPVHLQSRSDLNSC
jgi:hypothetical protein